MKVPENVNFQLGTDIQLQRDNSSRVDYRRGRFAVSGGNDGLIYPFRDQKTGKAYVAKTILPNDTNPYSRQRLIYESETVASLQNYSFVPRLVETALDAQGKPYMVMEDLTDKGYVPLKSVRKRRQWNGQKIGVLLDGLSDAARQLIRHNIFHGDLHETNVLIGGNGITVVDFSHCSLVNERISAERSHRQVSERPFPHIEKQYAATIAVLVYQQITGNELFVVDDDPFEFEGGAYGYFSEKKFFRHPVYKKLAVERKQQITDMYRRITKQDPTNFPEIEEMKTILQP